MRLLDYSSSLPDLYFEPNVFILPGTANCVRQDWWNLMVVLVFSLLNRAAYSGWAQPVSAVSGSVSTLPARPSSCRLPGCVCYDVMVQWGRVRGCVWGVGGGRRWGKITMMAEPLTFWSWPSSEESPAGWSLFAAAGEGPHVAISVLLALPWANGLGSWPQGQKVRRRPWANTFFSEWLHICIQSSVNCMFIHNKKHR